MAKKKRPAKAEKPITEKQRLADDELRERLRNANMSEFDKALQKAIRPVVR